MRKLPIVNRREAVVGNILYRHMSKEGCRVHAMAHLASVINKELGEWLPDEDFDFLTRSHFDFVVTKDNVPLLVVEFDGAHHLTDSKSIANDIIKNRLCKRARLPLLRITTTEVEDNDKVTLLDYMLMRYIAWGKEYPSLALDPDADITFDVRHPFPARQSLVERLWENHKIAWTMASIEQLRAAEYLCNVEFGDPCPLQRDQFHTCARRARLWRRSGTQDAPIMSDTVAVTLRAWLPLHPDIPEPDLWVCRDKKGQRVDWGEGMRRRLESMWFSNPPGVSPGDLADNYSEYLGLRSIERWARKHRLGL